MVLSGMQIDNSSVVLIGLVVWALVEWTKKLRCGDWFSFVQHAIIMGVCVAACLALEISAVHGPAMAAQIFTGLAVAAVAQGAHAVNGKGQIGAAYAGPSA